MIQDFRRHYRQDYFSCQSNIFLGIYDKTLCNRFLEMLVLNGVPGTYPDEKLFKITANYKAVL